MKGFFLRVTLLVPWVFLIWLIAEGMQGDISGLLVFFLLFILIPLAMVMNLVTVIAFQGATIFRMARQVQRSKDVGNTKLRSENYADLPWWSPKRWL